MLENILGILLVIAILGGAAAFTQWFATRMYFKCSGCGTLNARRRDRCRQCGHSLPS